MKRVTEKCASCGACIKRCPKNAISFQKIGIQEVAMIDEEKCVNCKKCFKLCPNNIEKEQNKVITKVARIKNEENIKKSTSGGIFGELARYFLRQEGVVYGAAFAEDYKSVHHIRCTTEEELYRILKSKYVRSYIDNTYVEAEKDLKKHKKVLFSGTPCQIAGLKRYLQKDYPNLYTVDIICHGTPSPMIWKKYASLLEEIVKGKITDVDFRYLDLENPTKNFKIKFDNDKLYKENLYDTSYGRAFLIGLINNNSCGDCHFNDFRNESDLTLGDAWGYHNKTYPTKNSLIFINSKKGKDLYRKIQSELIEFDDFNLNEMLPECYPIIHSTLNHDNFGRVNPRVENIDKELWYWLDEKNGLIKDNKGVGILNFHYENYNYGANLVAYSLSKVIKDLGYNPYVINFDPFADLDSIKRYQTMNMYKFRKKYLNMTPRFKKREDLELLNDYLDMYVVGSDQVWRKEITQDNIYTYFLDFAKEKNKVSYAASFGKDYFEGNNIDKVRCARYLSSFYNISVRENSGLDILNNDFHTTGQGTIDPTLLLSKEDYEQIIDDEYKEKVDVAVYFIMDFDNKILQDKNFKRLFPRKKIVNIKGEEIEKPFGTILKYNSISKWLDGIRKAEYVVTDSYHGLIFGLLFEKKVMCIGKNSASLSRFKTLIENLSQSIEKIMYSSLDEIDNINQTPDYKELNKNLEEMRKKSIKFLKDSLGKKNIREEIELYKYADEVAQKCIELEKQAENATAEVNKMVHSRSWRITKPVRYLKRVVKSNE